MRRLSVSFFLVLLLIFSASASAGARPDKDWKNWFGHFNLGYSFPTASFGDLVDEDWSLSGGATYWPESWPVGLSLELGWTEYDFKSSAIQALNDAIGQDPNNGGLVSGGDVEDWSFSVNALWGPDTSGPVGVYLLGGVGADYLKGRLTDNGLVYYPPICDPWYWWCIPGGVGPGTVIRSSESTTEFSWSAGVGLTFEVGTGSQLYLEARYDGIETDRTTTETIPIVLGYRW
jgi:opacity protein-like surface antigen